MVVSSIEKIGCDDSKVAVSSGKEEREDENERVTEKVWKECKKGEKLKEIKCGRKLFFFNQNNISLSFKCLNITNIFCHFI